MGRTRERLAAAGIGRDVGHFKLLTEFRLELWATLMGLTSLVTAVLNRVTVCDNLLTTVRGLASRGRHKGRFTEHKLSPRASHANAK